jgi:hypothetical protein
MKPFFLFASGAGALSMHPWMRRWAKRLSEFGKVETFDHEDVREGRERSDKLRQKTAAGYCQTNWNE